MKKLNLKGVTADTWARTITFLIAFIAQLLAIIGVNTKSINIDETAEYVTFAISFIFSAWSWWKNNSFTDKAQQADRYMWSVIKEAKERAEQKAIETAQQKGVEENVNNN